MYPFSILYAEDEEQTRLNYTNYLGRFFQNVYSATNGKEALDIYENNKPEILLLDINIPYISGLNLAKKIRESDKKTRIIILTAHLEQDKLLFAAELNLTKYLPKPISRGNLKEALELAVNQYKELQETRDIISFNEEYSWDKKEKKLCQDKKEIKLTKQEILLLELLSSQRNRVFSVDDISLYLWDDISTFSSTTKIKDIIKRLRKKLPKDTLVNIYGSGYKLNTI
jgi:DNA-binding response OmpR family regulator